MTAGRKMCEKFNFVRRRAQNQRRLSGIERLAIGRKQYGTFQQFVQA